MALKKNRRWILLKKSTNVKEVKISDTLSQTSLSWLRPFGAASQDARTPDLPVPAIPYPDVSTSRHPGKRGRVRSDRDPRSRRPASPRLWSELHPGSKIAEQSRSQSVM
ncbi:hypothetical protein HUJ04_010046 [Dendroctonus ponderosae]|nr:hypothetical protein HUJ04_010046 [Dendroctonus ponderosae]